LIQDESLEMPEKAMFKSKESSITMDDSDSVGEHDTVKSHESSEHPQNPEFLAAVLCIAA
jgi:hypothetical protein